MTFGYKSIITEGYKPVQQSNLFGHAESLLGELTTKRRLAPDRHLLFIVHSLGGIVVKETMRHSDNHPDSNNKRIFNSTTGIFFFGTPHKGSRDWATFGDGITKAASFWLADSNRQIIYALLPSAPELQLCRELFMAQWMANKDRLIIRTFQESESITGIRLANLNRLIP